MFDQLRGSKCLFKNCRKVGLLPVFVTRNAYIFKLRVCVYIIALILRALESIEKILRKLVLEYLNRGADTLVSGPATETETRTGVGLVAGDE